MKKKLSWALCLALLLGALTCAWGAGAEHPYVKNARSKIAVLRQWAEDAGDAEAIAFAEVLDAMLPE